MAWSCADDTCLLPHDHDGECLPYCALDKPMTLTNFLKNVWEIPPVPAPKAPKISEEGPAGGSYGAEY